MRDYDFANSDDLRRSPSARILVEASATGVHRMWAVEQRIEEIHRQSVEQAQRLLLDVIESCLPDDDVLDAANFYRGEKARLLRSQDWRDKARPGDDIRVFEWGAVGDGSR